LGGATGEFTSSYLGAKSFPSHYCFTCSGSNVQFTKFE
jgi:hypothetical protein